MMMHGTMNVKNAINTIISLLSDTIK
jgi:hypothetical protein